MNYSWSLAVSTFNFWDRLKICSFFLNPNNRWTQGVKVKEYEKIAQDFTGIKYAVMVSSGSTANQLICQQIKDRLIKNNEWGTRNQVILNSVTWQSNCSVWIREGFKPIFIDVNMDDFCLDYKKLSSYLKINHRNVAAVFPTSVLGYTPDIALLRSLAEKYIDIKFALDNCENFFGSYASWNICSYFTCSTSGFVAHHINSGAESGIIFTNNEEEYEYFLLARAHGLQRNLWGHIDSAKIERRYTNNLVDPQFDFQALSSNYRSSDIMAYLSILDSQKWGKHWQRRNELYEIFLSNIDRSKYYLPASRVGCRDVAFCLPIIVKDKNKELYDRLKSKLFFWGIESRPFISGNMLRQKHYEGYGDYKKFKNAEYLNNFAVYVGLHPHLKDSQVVDLCNQLRSL